MSKKEPESAKDAEKASEIGETVADKIAKDIKQTSVAEFFERNRHLLGFDSKIKAMITCIKETVDNSIDACEEMIFLNKEKKLDYSLPEVTVKIKSLGDDRFTISVMDNGPGIVKAELPQVFTRLLYGSKFNKIKQGRGQQGIGVSAAVLYSQLTTGKATHVVSKIGADKPAYYYDLRINTVENKPEIVGSGVIEKFKYDHGTEVEMEIAGTYLSKGDKSPYEYLRRTSIVNPHVRIVLITPENKKITFPRLTENLPSPTKAIQPHPYGVEVGLLIKMAQFTKTRTMQSFLTDEFSRIGPKTAKDILDAAKVDPRYKPTEITREQANKIVDIMQKTKFMSPPLDCLSSIGNEALKKSLKSEFDAEFVTTVSRSPSVYRGMPFLVEAALAYGGSLPAEEQVKVIRYGNKVPLLYDAGACAITSIVSGIDWRRYGLTQTGGRGAPTGPVMIVVHMASTWMPYTSESKSAIAHYDPIMKEMKLALLDCARNLRIYLSRKHKAQRQKERISTFVRYANKLVDGIVMLTDKQKDDVNKVINGFISKKYGGGGQ